ncbi:MAG: VWA domain-containing protein [Bacteroidia bacterium]|nr:VWA domain-containing protein [Bacteroidia bacterium]
MHRCYVFLLPLLMLTQALVAQPSLEIKSLEVNYPKVRVYFKVGCNGVNRNDFQKQQFELYENGKLMTAATLHCFDEPDCCVSAVLVLDRSGSMLGQRFINMRTGASSFVNEMNPDGKPCDEAAIVSFANDVRLDVPMTSDKGALLAGINNIVPVGGTAMWDGVAAAIQELLRSAKNSCRAVIVLSDGGDNGSKVHNLNSVVQMALRDSIRVFTIGLGSAADKNLPALASRTGGKHYQSATGADLAEIYSAIRTGIIGWSFPWCYLEYETGCPDGTERTVELKLKNYCGGTVSQTVRYIAPYLPEKFQKVTLRVGDAEAQARSEVLLPVYLDTPVSGMFGKSYVSIFYDENLLELLEVTAGPLLAGKAFSYQKSNSTIFIRLEEDVELNTSGGVLYYLRFRTADPPSTVRTPVQIVHWSFEKYCLEPVTRDGSVLIRARVVFLSCSTSGPVTLRWNAQTGGYEPTSFDISISVINTGNKEVEDVRVTLMAEAGRIKLINPVEFTQSASPSTIPPSGSASASWRVEIASYKDLRNFPIRFRIMVNDVLYDECELLVSFDSLRDDFMHCDVQAPDVLRWNVRDRRYEGNPFPVIVNAYNGANIPAQNVRVTLTTDPAAIRLVAPTQTTQAMTPDTIPPGRQGSAQWTLEAVGSDIPRVVTLHMKIEADNLPTVECERILRIEAGVYPLLSCSVTMPDSVNWNEQRKSYEPNPFDITVTVPNVGSTDAENVRATLVYDPRVLRLLTPAVAQQTLTPASIPRGGYGTAVWTVEALQQQRATAVNISVMVEADNHAPINCFGRIEVDSALTTGIACELSAPDTVYFRDQYYEPEEFAIGVRVRNTGSAATRDVRAQLLQDTRFTILSSGSQLLADVLPPGADASGDFRVRIHARDTDGYDTVWVNIQGDDTDPVWCYHPIWVQRVRMPRFDLRCEMESDGPVFDPTRNDYIPNPLTFSTTALNTGETWAEDCQIMLVGQTLLTPVGSTLRDIGTMLVNDERRDTWSVRVLPRAQAGWDTLTFQVLGRGGLGRQIVVAECRLPVFVPATRESAYTVSCEAPDTLYFVDGGYIPDPFVFTARVRNSGSSTGRNLRVRLELPAGVLPAAGETLDRVFPALGADEEVAFTWNLHAERRPHDGDYDMCVRVIDAVGASGSCCTPVRIWRSSDADLSVQCLAVDTLFVDEARGEYVGNPFEVKVFVRSTGSEMARDVRATLIVPGHLAAVLDPVTHSFGDLADTAPVAHSWRVQALRQPIGADMPLRIEVVGANVLPTRDTHCAVHLMANPEPALLAQCSIEPSDTLYFDETTGTFTVPEVRLTMRIRNNGAAGAAEVRAYALAPEAMTLLPGESAIKPLPSVSLAPGGSDSISWRFRPIFNESSGWREFRAVVSCANGSSVECVTRLYVQGARRQVTLAFPEYSVLRYREKQLIPLMISRTVVAKLSEYTIRIAFDPALLRVNGLSTQGTLTGRGWVGAGLRSRGEGVLEVYDYTTVAPLATEDGVLFLLQVEGMLDRNWGSGSFGETAIRIDTAHTRLNRGAISYEAVDGRVIVTDACLEPLMAPEGYTLGQNRPNPFNPSTVIEYTLPETGHIRLRVFDRHGRDVRTLVDEVRDAGRHEITLDASDMPSGMYFYRLEHARGVEMKKMVLLR